MKTVVISITVAVSLIVLALLLSGPSSSSSAPQGVADGQNVHMEGGTQVIEVFARGGYSPRLTSAKAGVPTILRMKTAGTFDCSSALSIPALGVRESLPSSGEKDIQVPPQQPGTVLEATCAMGMYNFQVKFQ